MKFKFWAAVIELRVEQFNFLGNSEDASLEKGQAI